MAHKAQREFCDSVRVKYPEMFKNKKVLDVGSLDNNGNNRFLFEDYEYVGLDIGEGNNVDVVSRGHEYKDPNQFDVVISSECFEHDMYYNLTIMNGIELTKPSGLFTFTCASLGRPEHGTNKTKPEDAPLLSKYEDWGDYYKNLTEEDIREVFNPDEYFSEYEFEYNPKECDLYFWGIKK